MDSNATKPTGHLQVRPDKNGRTRSYHAFWEDAAGKHAKCLGRAHVKDTGRKTPRGAVIWRAGDGPKPTPKHLTPREAEAGLEQILRNAENTVETACATNPLGTLRGSSEGWLAERRADKDLKRSTVEDYEEMFERLYRDHGAETPIIELTAKRLEPYFADFKAERVLPKAKAEKALTQVLDLQRAVRERAVVYMSLDADRHPLLAEMLGAAVVSDLVTLIAGLQRQPIPTVVVIDEFSAVAAGQVARLFGRARSAGVSLVLGTQELADLKTVGDGVLREQILGNLAGLIAHRQNVPESAELIAGIAGTEGVWVSTQQTEQGLLTSGPSGRGTRRRGYEYAIHPDHIKRLDAGQAVVITPGARQKPTITNIHHPDEARP